MTEAICPGQNTMFWKPDDVFEIACPVCDYPVEFFKDDVSRKCSNCGYNFPNPRLDMGCLEWCPYADKCRAALESGELAGYQGPAGGEEGVEETSEADREEEAEREGNQGTNRGRTG